VAAAAKIYTLGRFVRISLLTIFCAVLLCAGCFPFGGNVRKVAGDFRLEQWEDGTTYYLHQRGHDDSKEGGSIIGGTVVSIGWSSRYILAQRYSISRGDPDGWMIIDTQSGNITGPFTDAQLSAHAEAAGITTFPVAEAWRRL
jgi:hypothetical protein